MPNEPVTFRNPSDSALEAQIDLKASPERVYQAWTEPDAFRKWFGPRSGGSLEVARFDCTEGGGFDVTMVFSDGDRVQMTGQYRELDPPSKLVFTWQWTENASASEETLVTIDLVPSAAGTFLTLVHERFASTEARDQHQQGWGPLLAKLDAVLA